ncbi:MAG: hypothetical protein ACM3TN_16910 [Alphaproteobacteria bacterium]
MKRFLVVLIASFFLASAAYAAEETKDMKESKGAATTEKAKDSKAKDSKAKSKAKSKSKAKDEKAKDEKAKEEKK